MRRVFECEGVTVEIVEDEPRCYVAFDIRTGERITSGCRTVRECRATAERILKQE